MRVFGDQSTEQSTRCTSALPGGPGGVRCLQPDLATDLPAKLVSTPWTTRHRSLTGLVSCLAIASQHAAWRFTAVSEGNDRPG